MKELTHKGQFTELKIVEQIVVATEVAKKRDLKITGPDIKHVINGLPLLQSCIKAKNVTEQFLPLFSLVDRNRKRTLAAIFKTRTSTKEKRGRPQISKAMLIL